MNVGNITLNKKQALGFQEILKGQNVFVSGPGGVGKSVIINKLREMNEESTIVMAPTGIAALNVEGSTIHRIFRFPFGYLGPNERTKVADKAKSLFEDDQIKRIVLDELSMARVDVVDAIDRNLRKIKRNNVAFGGLQIVGSGDFFQLPPVLNNNSPEAKWLYSEYKTPYAFSSRAWQDSNILTIELDQIMRQNDARFIEALNSIRQKDVNYIESLRYINNTCLRDDVDEDNVFLCATNKQADVVNSSKFAELDTPIKYFEGHVSGDFKDLPIEKDLQLRVGAKVLLTVNAEDYVNGSVGHITHIDSNEKSGFVMVELTTGETVRVVRYKWQNVDYTKGPNGIEKTVIGTYVQYPIRLGWGITIHKSQGMTLENAIIYLGNGAFCHGQTYVALSRLRTIQGLALLKEINNSDIIVDQEVRDFYERNKTANLFNI